ncbi:MAG: hypothetical protein P1U74_10590 [Legionellaceae bacterium]|nr:hypothetical protein [Legionellaceae bacterium]
MNLVKDFYMKLLVVFILIFSSWLVNAQEILPSGCLPIVINSSSVVIPKEKHAFIVMHNLSASTLWVIHRASKDSSLPDSSSKIDPGKWSSLVLNHQPEALDFICIESTPGHEQQTSCRDVLAVCQWPKSKVPEQRKKGVYWIAEGMEMHPLTTYLERLGFSLS